jgi:hypothetical protein
MERRQLRDEVKEVEKQVAAEPSPSLSRGDLGWEGPVIMSAMHGIGYVLRRWKALTKRSNGTA